MLDFRIETFLTVRQTMNYTEAARQLHITQPAVSQHIRALEQQYGADFFHYQGKRLSLTEAGQLFYRTALAMRHDAAHLKDQIQSLSSSPVLNFGATLTIGEYIMPEPLLHLIQTRPDIRLRMMVENTDELLKLLNQGEIDFAIIEGYYSRFTYDGLVFKTERFLPVCAASYPQADRLTRFSDLFSERLLVREPGSGTREVLERALLEHNIALQDFPKLTELGNLNAIKALAAAGAGVAFFYESVVEKEIRSGILKVIPLRSFHVTHDFTFLWQKDSVFAGYYRQIFDMLRQPSLR